MTKPTNKVDVVVVGGGPAGLAAAIAARIRGLEVLLADIATPPIDKACGEGLMPDGVAALRALGVDPAKHEHAIFRGIRFAGPDHAVESHFPAGEGIGLRRTALHDALRHRATQLGIDTRWNTRVSGIAPGAVFLPSGTIETRWIVGADGRNSRVREWAGLSAGSRSCLRVGLRRHFRVKRWTDVVEVYWGHSGQAYVTPVASDEICVAVISRNLHAHFDQVIAECPELARRLDSAAPLDAIKGSATETHKLRAVTAAGVALIGEASGSVDAVTGEGMALAFQQAVKLGDALLNHDLDFYAREHRRIARLPNLLGSAMLLMDRNPGFRSRALHALSRKSRLFDRLLAVHLGEKSPLDFGLDGIATLGWELLTAH